MSRYDGTISAPVAQLAGEHHSDPVLDYTVSVLSPAFVAYVRSELGYSARVIRDQSTHAGKRAET